MSIIGAKQLIPHFIHRRAPKGPPRDPKVSKEYDRRKAMLSKLGYGSYAEYLASDAWKEIRSRVLAQCPQCLMCDRPAAVVHHVKYFDTVLLGLQDSCLAPLCHDCHELIEVQHGKKTRMGTANCTLFEAARKTPQGRRWAAEYYKRLRRDRGPKCRS